MAVEQEQLSTQFALTAGNVKAEDPPITNDDSIAPPVNPRGSGSGSSD